MGLNKLMKRSYPFRYFKYEYVSSNEEILYFTCKKKPHLTQKWYIQENMITKNNYEFDYSDYASICSKDKDNKYPKVNNLFSLVKCYSLKTQLLHQIIKKYQKYKENFNLLPEDLRFQLNYIHFVNDMCERKAELKYLVYPQNEKFSRSYAHICHIFNEKNLIIRYDFNYCRDHNVSKDYYLLHDHTNYNYNLGIWETHDFIPDEDDWNDFIDLGTYFDFNLDIYLDSEYEIDNIKNFKKLTHICKLVNRNPYIDGKLKFFNVINRTHKITELFQLKNVYC